MSDILETACELDNCNDPISDFFGVKCVCKVCENHCAEICFSDFQCSCYYDLMNIKLDSEFKTEKEMQYHARYKGKVILTKHTQSFI